jgi:hypothetical protein
MSSIEEIWSQVQAGGPGGGIRVSADHASELFGATDQQGRPGLVLITASEPPMRPSLDSVEITSGQRSDGRWALGIWLRDDSLLPVFTRLSADLIESSSSTPPTAAAAFLLTRLVRWRELLESGTGPMSSSRLRGLVGELIVFESCLDLWPAADVVAGWVGPLGGPQDFVLPGRRVEVKTTFASARSIHISSPDQLDTDEELTLAVVSLTTLAGGEGIAPTELVERVEKRLIAHGADLGALFRKRLDAVGYLPDPQYSKPMFRLDTVQYFDVSGNFPRIRRDAVPAGIERIVYDVLVGSCAPYRSSLKG